MRDVSLNDIGGQFNNLAQDFSNWGWKMYSGELEGPQKFFAYYLSL